MCTGHISWSIRQVDRSPAAIDLIEVDVSCTPHQPPPDPANATIAAQEKASAPGSLGLWRASDSLPTPATQAWPRQAAFPERERGDAASSARPLARVGPGAIGLGAVGLGAVGPGTGSPGKRPGPFFLFFCLSLFISLST
jgi:hypothetical protein